MLVPAHLKQCSSSTASHCNECARYRNTKNDHDIGTQTHAQDFELTRTLTRVVRLGDKSQNGRLEK